MSSLKSDKAIWKKYLKQENLSKEEIAMLSILLEKKVVETTDRFLEKDRKKHIQALNRLAWKKIIKKKRTGKITRYSLESLEKFFDWIQINSMIKMKTINDDTNTFINALRRSLGDAVKSKVMFFEGIEGIKKSYDHILKYAKDEICNYFSVVETVQPHLQIFMDEKYTPERIKRKIHERSITVQTPKTTYFKLKSRELLMELRTVPPTMFPLMNTEINLYGKFMHCMVFNENGGFAVIVEDRDIVKMQKTLFELAWKFCDQGVHDELRLKMKTDAEPLHALRQHTYVTDNIETILGNIESRRKKFKGDLREKWPKAKAEYVKTKKGETILKICNLEVMSDFETPYLNKLAEIATIHGGKILHIGYGLGIIDNFIQEQKFTRKIDELHIVEMNEQVYEAAKKWRAAQQEKEKIILHKGEWRDVLVKLQKKKIQFDGVIYDGYPLDIDEICRDAVNFLYSLIHLKLVKEHTGIVTFYMDSVDGVGERFQKYLRTLGVGEIQIKKVEVKLPKRHIEYWERPFFLAPMLTDIRY